MSPNRPSPELLLAHADFVRDLARSLLHDVHAAEDVAQDALAAALERPPVSAASLRSWLARVTRNFAYQAHRSTSRRRDRERAIAQAEEASVEEIASREAARGELVRALLALQEPMRTPILLRYYEGLPPRAISKRLNSPVETVRTRIKRGLARVRADLQDSKAFSERDFALALLPLAERGPGAVAALSILFAGSTKAKAAFGIALALIGLITSRALLRSPAPAGGELESIPMAELSDEARGADPEEEPGRSIVSTSEERVLITGSVLDPRGAPAPHAMVYASPSGPIGSDLHRSPPGSTPGDGPPSFAKSNDEGSFSLELPRPRRVYVAVARSGDPFLEPRDGIWVDAPAREVVLSLDDVPRAGIVLRATAEKSGQWLRDFPVVFHSSVTKTYIERRAEGAELRCELPLQEGLSAADFQALLDVPGFKPWSRVVRLEQGHWIEVEALLQGSGTVRGRVVDPAGAAVEGALVFFGLPMRLRGDEPFKPFQPERVQDGTLAAPDGSFELLGSGDRLSAWHPDFGAATVALADAGRIALPSLGAIRGRILDRARSPRENVRVTLDRGRETTTDADGRFEFDRVFAGVRGLVLEPPDARPGAGSVRIGVLVQSGESVELQLGADWIDGALELEGEGGETPFTGKALLVGLDPICSVAEVALENGRAQIQDLLPGRYLLVSPEGPLAFATIEGPYTKLALGKADLTITATSGDRAFLVVEGAHELAELLAARIAARRIPSNGEIRFETLPAATWSVGIEGRGLMATVEVAGPGTRVRLP